MSGLAIYFLIYFVVSALCTAFYIGNGGYKATVGALVFSLVWTLVNVALIVFVGF